MSASVSRQPWRDWVLFAAAYGVIMGTILFAYPPTQLASRDAAPVGQAITVH